MGGLEVPAATAWAGVVSLVGMVTAWLTTRKRTNADMYSVISDTSLEWIRELRSENNRLSAELESMRNELELCQERCGRMSGG